MGLGGDASPEVSPNAHGDKLGRVPYRRHEGLGAIRSALLPRRPGPARRGKWLTYGSVSTSDAKLVKTMSAMAKKSATARMTIFTSIHVCPLPRVSCALSQSVVGSPSARPRAACSTASWSIGEGILFGLVVGPCSVVRFPLHVNAAVRRCRRAWMASPLCMSLQQRSHVERTMRLDLVVVGSSSRGAVGRARDPPTPQSTDKWVLRGWGGPSDRGGAGAKCDEYAVGHRCLSSFGFGQ